MGGLGVRRVEVYGRKAFLAALGSDEREWLEGAVRKDSTEDVPEDTPDALDGKDYFEPPDKPKNSSSFWRLNNAGRRQTLLGALDDFAMRSLL